MPFVINRDGRPGRLATMPKPLGGHLLAGEMAAFAADGWTTIVSLLPMDQILVSDLQAEAEAAAAEGMSFVLHPILDFGIPKMEPFIPVIDDLATRLAAGESIAIHCWMGIGRASLTAAAVLLVEGHEPDDAWTRITAARGKRVPENGRQTLFIDEYAEYLANPTRLAL